MELQIVATISLGRAADPREIAETIVFLASDPASYLNEQSFRWTAAASPSDGCLPEPMIPGNFAARWALVMAAGFGCVLGSRAARALFGGVNHEGRCSQ